MTTASTNTVVAQDTDAHFILWVQEVLTNLITNCGLTQTADTGQITSSMGPPVVNPATTRAGANTSAGYVILRFNDTLQSTSAIFIKLEFGSAAANNDPQMWITVGTGSNGSGTINGTVMTRVAMGNGGAPASLITNYTSRYCYNATQGFLGMAFKIGATSLGGNANLMGFAVFRSVNAAGNPTADSVMLLTNSSTATGGNNSGFMQVLSYNLSAAYLNTAPIPTSAAWGFIPFTSTTSLEGTSGNIFPIFQWAGSSSSAGYGITNALALTVLADIAVGATVTVTVLGSVSLTYICVGTITGGSTMIGSLSYSAATYGVLMLWQ